MPGFEEMFIESSKIVAGYFHNAAKNAQALHDGRTDFIATDMAPLFDKFCSHKITKTGVNFIGQLPLDEIFTPEPSSRLSEMLSARGSEQIKFIMLGSADREQTFSPTIMRNMFELHTAIFTANAIISILQSGQNAGAEMKQALGTSCDDVMFRATTLEGMFTHAANMAQHPSVYRFTLNLIGMGMNTPLTQEEHDSAAEHNEDCRLAYDAAIPRSGENLMKKAFDRKALQERIRISPSPLSTLPLWFVCGHSVEDRFVNDVWIPQVWAVPLFNVMAQEQAKAIGESRGLG